jgi:hypothetical protein
LFVISASFGENTFTAEMDDNRKRKADDMEEEEAGASIEPSKRFSRDGDTYATTPEDESPAAESEDASASLVPVQEPLEHKDGKPGEGETGGAVGGMKMADEEANQEHQPGIPSESNVVQEEKKAEEEIKPGMEPPAVHRVGKNEGTPKDQQEMTNEKRTEDKDKSVDQGGNKLNGYDNLRYCIIENDGKPDSLVKLIGLKSLFSKQLPKMPRTYIARLVFDRRHKSLAILSDDPQHKGGDEEIIGAICYRGFYEMRFAEIAFCAVNSSHQVKVCLTSFVMLAF